MGFLFFFLRFFHCLLPRRSVLVVVVVVVCVVVFLLLTLKWGMGLFRSGEFLMFDSARIHVLFPDMRALDYSRKLSGCVSGALHGFTWITHKDKLTLFS